MSGYVTIDDNKVEIEGERNLLEMVRKTGVDLPTFCYHSELSIYGACRLCLVETDKGAIISSCSTPPSDGMIIKTNTPRLMRIRKMILELYLANHDRECTMCPKSGKCRLQELAKRFGIDQIHFPSRKAHSELDLSSPSIVRNENKCVLCGDCVRTCAEIQGVGVIGFAGRGANERVMCAFNRGLGETDCINCGQCVAVCPTGALTTPSQVDNVWKALSDPTKHVVISVAPSVRVAIGEEFGYKLGSLETGRMVSAIRRLGFNEVFDTCFAADLTTIEECAEFIKRFTTKKDLPHFTSCCPAWVKMVETKYPEKIHNLSTTRSPEGIYGGVMRHYFVDEKKMNRDDVYIVSVMPCTAKKFEVRRPQLADENGHPDIDAVITTAELAAMIKSAGIVFDELPEDSFDIPFGFSSGSAVIYGVSGGVATAVVREARYTLAGIRSNEVNMEHSEKFPGLMTADIPLPSGDIVHLGVVSGMGNIERVIKAMDEGELKFDIVECMACPGGCVGGGGQPIPNGMAERKQRTIGLNAGDARQQLRVAHDNILAMEQYQRWLKEPCSEEAEKYLHTTYCQRSRETQLEEK